MRKKPEMLTKPCAWCGKITTKRVNSYNMGREQAIHCDRVCATKRLKDRIARGEVTLY